MSNSYLKTYIDFLEKAGNRNQAQAIAVFSDSFWTKHFSTWDYAKSMTGLLFGNIQSGKTSHMFGAMCKAADEGISAFVLLTADNTLLQQQTLTRAKHDLETNNRFKVFDESEQVAFEENQLREPAVIVLKKNHRVLHDWSEWLASFDFLKLNPLFVLDDEADAESLNTLINEHKVSSVNRFISRIRKSTVINVYLQVTATPENLLLQASESGWKPDFIDSFEPGQGYIGGNFFFSENRKPDCVTLTDNGDFLSEAIARHLTVSALEMGAGSKCCNCLLNVSSRQADHESVASAVKSQIEQLVQDPISLAAQVGSLMNDISHSSLDTVATIAKEAINLSRSAKVLIINGNHRVDPGQYSQGCNFIVGGNSLGRGVTFPMLQTIYYSRVTKVPQADTLWQQCRMFGYDRDPKTLKLYMQSSVYKVFQAVNSTNNMVMDEIARGETPKIMFLGDINPTRKNVLNHKALNIISGGHFFYPDSLTENLSDIDSLLQEYSDDTQTDVEITTMYQLLKSVKADNDDTFTAALGGLKGLAQMQPKMHGILLLRRGRNVSAHTGALLSAADYQKAERYRTVPVLAMYEVIGKGWGVPRLWVPDIKFPDNMSYYFTGRP